MSVALRHRPRSQSALPVVPREARKAAIPRFIEPCHPTERSHAPTDNEYVHEVKFDGYRVQVHRTAEGVKVFTRNGLDWTDEFAHIAHAAGELKSQSFIIDGEAIVEDPHGNADWHALKRSLGTDKLRCYSFDLLYLNGYDLRRAPLMARKQVLRRLLGDNPVILPAEYFETNGQQLFEAA